MRGMPAGSLIAASKALLGAIAGLALLHHAAGQLRALICDLIQQTAGPHPDICTVPTPLCTARPILAAVSFQEDSAGFKPPCGEWLTQDLGIDKQSTLQAD